MRTKVKIDTNIIIWAIARAGYELDEFSIKYPKIQVQDWLEDKKRPTIKQLETFSKKVHLPFGYLFLKEPPLEKLPIPFFRTNNPTAKNVSVNVYDTILLMQQRQDWLKDYLKDNEFEPLQYVGEYRGRQNYKDIEIFDKQKFIEKLGL